MIYITTYGRGDVQPTYRQLAAASVPCRLVCDERDPFDYEGAGFACERGPYVDLRGKRHALWTRHYKLRTAFMLVDDDLRLCRSPAGQPIKPCKPSETRQMLLLVGELLETCAQVGVHHRPFVNYATRPYEYNKGSFPFRVMAYNPRLWRECPRPCPTYSGSDIWLWHELVKQQLDYAIVTDYCHSDALHPTIPTHYTEHRKIEDLEQLIKHMGAQAFAVQRKNADRPFIRYTKLAASYRK